MVCPGWTRTRSQPVSLRDVVETITRLIQHPEIQSGQYDLGSRDVMTYIDMMREVARQIGKKRIFLPIFLFSPNLSRLWVTLVTGAPRELIGPLVQSLRHEMVARDLGLMEKLGIEPQGFKECLAEALKPNQEALPAASLISRPPAVVVKKSAKPIVNLVCSVQRLPLIMGLTAAWVTKEYANWLIQFFRRLIFVRQDLDGSLTFVLRPFFSRFDISLLELKYAQDRSSEHRQMFYISGGLLLSSKFHPKGRFEFREVLKGRFVLVAIFDFVPALPWWIYKNTQALLHLFVMFMFRRHLKSLYQADHRIIKSTNF